MSETISERLVSMWWNMHAIALSGDAKAFKAAQDEFNRVYRRATNEEQGAYHWLLAHPPSPSLSALTALEC